MGILKQKRSFLLVFYLPDDTCTDEFTPQQVARMHCYLDLVYQPMRDMKQAPPIPIAPKVSYGGV